MLCCYRSNVSFLQQVTSCEMIRSFVADSLNDKAVSILSVLNDHILVGHESFAQFFIYSLEGRLISSVTISASETAFDAKWTSQGDIVYTTNSKKVVLISNSSEIISQTVMKNPHYLSVSYDNKIYLADYVLGIYQSVDGGVSWNFFFRQHDDWRCWQVVKVTTSYGDSFWTIETKKDDSNHHEIKMYTRHLDGSSTHKNLNVAIIDKRFIDLTYSSILFDGEASVLLSEWENSAIYVYSSNGQYQSELKLLLDYTKDKPLILSLERKRSLFVGHNKGLVKVCKLAQGPK